MNTPIKGRPFSSWSDEKLREHIEVFQNFNFAYRSDREYTEKKSLVSEILKDLKNEQIERTGDSFDREIEKNFSPKNRLKAGVSGSSPKKFPKKLKKSVDKRRKV